MKLSGIFWLIVIVAILYFASTFGWIVLSFTYLLWSFIAIILHNLEDEIDILIDDNFDMKGIKDLFLNYPYLYTGIHLFIVFLGISIYFVFGCLHKIFSLFNSKLDNIKLENIKIRKEKKKSYSEFKKDM